MCFLFLFSFPPPAILSLYGFFSELGSCDPKDRERVISVVLDVSFFSKGLVRLFTTADCFALLLAAP